MHWQFVRRAIPAAAMLALLTSCGSDPTSPAGTTRDPAQAQFHTSDVDRFWRAWDAGGREGNATVFQRIYLDSASTGLRDLIAKRSVTAQSLVQVATSYRQYMDVLRTWWPTAPVTALQSTVRANYTRMQQEYPEAEFSPVYLMVGRFSTGGTVGSSGMLIGAEFFGVDAQAPVGELNNFARSNQMSFSRDLPLMIAHEHVHTLQAAAGSDAGNNGRTVLQRSLAEGIAEFLCSRVAGRATFHRFFVVWQAREREFWLAFERERGGTDISRWLYNQGGAADNATAAWPGDLGYFMGYRIAEAYYLRADDKRAAVRELIRLRDAEAILRASGYSGGGPALSP